MKTKHIWLILAAAGVVVAIGLLLRGPKPTAETEGAELTDGDAPRQRADAGPTAKKPLAKTGAALAQGQEGGEAATLPADGRPAVEEADSETAAERKLAEEMQEKLDSDDTQGALELARQLLKAKDPAVRTEVATALGWIGIKGLPELAALLGDADEEAAHEAQQQFMMQLAEIEDPNSKARMLALAAQQTSDEDTLQELMIAGVELPEAEYVLNFLVPVIESGNAAAAELAREEYESTTDAPYTTAQDAAKWAAEHAAPEEL